MTRFIWTIVLIVAGLWSSASAGQSSCLPAFNSLQTAEVFDPKQPAVFIRALATEGASGLIQTKVQLVGRPSKDVPNALDLSVRFDPNFNGVSLPYNLYSVLVIRDGEVMSWMDFTKQCQGPGIGFYPGQEVHLPLLKFDGGDAHKLQIMIWGRI
jgi:hypothetical protein